MSKIQAQKCFTNRWDSDFDLSLTDTLPTSVYSLKDPTLGEWFDQLASWQVLISAGVTVYLGV